MRMILLGLAAFAIMEFCTGFIRAARETFCDDTLTDKLVVFIIIMAAYVIPVYAIFRLLVSL